MRVAYLVAEPPCPPISGGRQRSYLQARALREIAETRLVLVCDQPPTREEVAETERQFGPMDVVLKRPMGSLAPWRWGRWASPALVDRAAMSLDLRYPGLVEDPKAAAEVERIVREFKADLTMARYFVTAMRAGIGREGSAPAVLDLDDADTEYLRELVRDPSTRWWRRGVTRARLRRLERRFGPELRRFAGVLVSSPADLEIVHGLSAEVAPNIPFVNQGDGREALPPAPAKSAEILQVATWGYMPNILGLKRFLARCWPRIRARVPGAVLNVVGGGMRAQDRAEWERVPGVRLTGFVQDLEGEYRRAAFAIAPIYQGGGTKIKVLEALAYGRTCVVTAQSHRGYEATLVSGRALLTAPSDAEFAEACVRLLEDPGLRDSLAARGHEVVREQYTYPRVRDVVHAAVRKAAGNRR